MVEGKTKTLTKLTSQDIYKIWGAKNPPYEHLVNIETKNRLTANDAAIDATADVAALKTNQTCDIFRFLEEKGITTTFISQKDSSNFIAKECDMIPYECVARRKAFGSYLKRNTKAKSGDIFGKGLHGSYTDPLIEFFYKLAVIPQLDPVVVIPEDIARDRYLKNGEWSTTVYTDPLMIWQWADWRLAGEDHDSVVDFNIGLYPAKESQANSSNKLTTIASEITPNEYHVIWELTSRVFMTLEKAWKEFDVELIDMKIEFGRDKNTGLIIVADVIDNDSWRIWPSGDPNKQLDKQSFRDGEKLDTVTEKYRIVSDYTSKFMNL